MIYLYVGIAIVGLSGAAYLIYRKRSGQSNEGAKAEAELSEQAPESEASETEPKPEEEAPGKAPARPAAAAYRRATASQGAPSSIGSSRATPERPTTASSRWPSMTSSSRPPAPAPRGSSRPAPPRPATPATRGTSKTTQEPPDDTPASKGTYPITEYSTLSDDAKVQFMNAVWYRCENPYCNHTEFLDVHHIIDDGSNAFENLIVLCPKCNTAAHSNEITVEELKSWLVDREKRFKSDLDWPYR